MKISIQSLRKKNIVLTNFVFRMVQNIQTVWYLNSGKNPLENVFDDLSSLFKNVDDENLMAIFNNDAITAKGQ